MSELSTLIEAWDEGHREFAIALNGLADEDLWKRAHPRLLSVGELAGHLAYWQAVWIGSEGNTDPDPSTLPIQSPLINRAFRYYTGNIEEEFRLDLGTAQVVEELTRVHNEVKQALAGKEKDDPYPGQWRTWGNVVQYQVFHVAYHTGQAYSVRHLMGHETEDN